MIVGVANHIEIWAKHKWERMEEEEEGSFEEIAESLSDFMEL